MSVTYVSKALRQAVAADARYQCGYCCAQEVIIGASLEMDHIVPESLGGPTEASNLWLACSPCNDRKGDRIAALDPETREFVRIFNPRKQIWNEHFMWSADGDRILA